MTTDMVTIHNALPDLTDHSVQSVRPPAQDSGRTLALDGMRGLAALAVFFSHAQGMIPATPILDTLRRTPARILWDGAAAVSLFFVLSGFVLALPFVGPTAKRLGVGDFLVRRIFRIYPAYLVAISLSLILRLHGPVLSTEVSAWFRDFWTTRVMLSDLIRHAIMVGPNLNDRLIDPVIWSMVIEMRMSLLMPAFILMLRRTTVRSDVLILAAAVLSGTHFHFANAAPFFIGGIQLAKHRRLLASHVRRFSSWQRSTLLVASLSLYGSRMLGSEASSLVNYVAGIGAGKLILCVLYLPVCSAITSSRPALLLGHFSYSFYLIHLPVMIILTSWLIRPTHSLLACWGSSICASMLISAAIYHLVELPLQKVGKRVWPASYSWIRPAMADAAQ